MTDQATAVRCAAWARDEQLLPAGTAPRTDVFVLVEHPLPWPSDIAADPLLAAVERSAVAAAGRNRVVRLQAVVGDTAAPTRRVVVFAAGDQPFTGYGRSEGSGRPEDLPGLVASLIGCAQPPAGRAAVTDVLVCTHGSRDTCCGSLGTRLWMEAADGLADVRVWRTSHTGGHRFAPTAITFPDGNYWAHLDARLLEGIVTRRVPAVEAARHLRGCAAFSPAAQAADGAVLAERGWTWLEHARFADERSEHRVDLCFEDRGGERGCYDVTVEHGRSMPVPDCGRDPDAATKVQHERRVTRLQLWD